MPNCTIFQKFSRLSTILSFLKYNILTSHIYISKLCQDRLYTLYCFEKFSLLSTSPVVVSNQQMLSLFLRQKYYFHLKMLAILAILANEPNCTVQNFLESAYSLSMSTTKIIRIISSSTKILYLEDILLKCLPKNKTLIF